MAEYRNERVCLCVCLSVCERISGTTRPIVTSFRALLLFLPELANLRTFCTSLQMRSSLSLLARVA